MNHFFFTYVLLSERDYMFYTGYTRNIQFRLAQHTLGNVPSTSNHLPLKLIYFEACLSQTDALNRERYLKSGMGKRYIRNRLKNFVMESGNEHLQRYWFPDKSRKPVKKQHL